MPRLVRAALGLARGHLILVSTSDLKYFECAAAVGRSMAPSPSPTPIARTLSAPAYTRSAAAPIPRMAAMSDAVSATLARVTAARRRRNIRLHRIGVDMNIQIGLTPVISLVAGIAILVMPKLLNLIVAIYLIAIGLIGLFGAGTLHLS